MTDVTERRLLTAAEVDERIRALAAEGIYDPATAIAMAKAGGWPASTGQAADPGQAQDLFRLWTPAELLEADQPLSWRIRGLLIDPTYGPIGGEQKTLKSYVSTFISVGLAAGLPVFDHFKVDQPAPVVVYVGEGGRVPYTRRLKRVAAAMGANLSDIPLLTSFDVAPFGSARFDESLARDLRREPAPGLVLIDPLYAFHPPATSASNLYERGSMLASLSGRCMDAGASLLIPDHWNKTGAGRGLDRISQAGVQQWADSWLLLSHREDPDVEHGYFQLTLEIGSRQWGGSSWNLDLMVGRFDQDLGEYEGQISWELTRASTGTSRDVGTENAILTLLNDRPYELTQTATVAEIGGNKERARKTLERLMNERRVVIQKVPQMEGDRRVSRERLGIAEQPVPGSVGMVGPGSPP